MKLKKLLFGHWLKSFLLRADGSRLHLRGESINANDFWLNIQEQCSIQKYTKNRHGSLFVTVQAKLQITWNTKPVKNCG